MRQALRISHRNETKQNIKQELAEYFGMPYFEVSAVTRQNVDEVMAKFSELVFAAAAAAAAAAAEKEEAEKEQEVKAGPAEHWAETVTSAEDTLLAAEKKKKQVRLCLRSLPHNQTETWVSVPVTETGQGQS